MQTLDSNLILEKNKLAGTAPWLILLEVEVSTGSYIYLVKNTENITYNSQTYTAFPFEVEDRSQVSKGEIPSLTIKVGNPERTLQTYLEGSNGLVGNSVIVRIVSRYNDTGSWTQALSYTYDILSCTADAVYVTFTLGAPNPLNRRFPLYRYMTTHCNWAFMSTECNFTWTALGTWTALKTYYPGDLIYPCPTVTTRDFTFRCINAGVSGTTEPTWNTVTVAKVVENGGSSVLWIENSLTTWTASKGYYIGDYVHTTTSTGRMIYRALNDGTSGTRVPQWTTTVGSTFTDGAVSSGITWTVAECKRTLLDCRALYMSDNFGGHGGLSGRGMKVTSS